MHHGLQGHRFSGCRVGARRVFGRQPGRRANAAAVAAAAGSMHLDSVHADVRFGLDRNAIERATAKRGPGSFPAVSSHPVRLRPRQRHGVAVPSKTTNPMPSGSITQGLDLPVNDAVDKNGTVYVANNGNSTVTEYPWGQTSPSVTLSTDLVDPNGIAVDSAGTVYVTSGATVGQCSVLEFPKGATSPSVSVNGFGLPIGLALDKADNLYVADGAFGDNHIWEVPKGTTNMIDLKTYRSRAVGRRRRSTAPTTCMSPTTSRRSSTHITLARRRRSSPSTTISPAPTRSRSRRRGPVRR